jgi:hypothetical protein
MNDLLCIIPLNENVVFKGNNYEKVRNWEAAHLLAEWLLFF